MKTEYIKGKTQRDLTDEIQERSIKEFSKTHRVFIRTMRTIVKYFGEDWEQIIYDNPYRIMEIDGFGFRRADKIAMKIGHPKDSLHRIKAYVEVAIMDTSNGSTVVPTGKIVAKIGKDLELDNPFYIVEAVFEQEDNEFLMLDENFFRTKDILQCVYMTTKSWYETEKNFYLTMKELSNMEKITIDKNAIDIVKKQLAFKLNEKQEYAVDNILNKNINILIGKAGCLPDFTEVLTPKGWINISDWNGEEIMVIEPDKKLKRTGKFETPIFRKYDTDQFYNMKTGTNFDLTVSEQHKNLGISLKGFHYDITTSELLDKYNNLESQRNLTGKKNMSLINIPETFEWNDGKGIGYTDDYIRLKIAVMADGYFSKRIKSRPNACYVNIKRIEKQNRLEMLLKKNEIPYVIHKSAEGYKKFHFDMDNTEKIMSNKWFYETTTHQKQVIFEELLLRDGAVSPRKNSIGRFTTTIKEMADTVQLIAQSLGYRATLSKDKREDKYVNKECYDVVFSKNSLGAFFAESSNTTTFEKVEAGKYMYCFTTSTGYFLIRQHDKIYITGNCGKSFATKAILDVLDAHHLTYTLMTPTGISSSVLTDKTNRQSSTIHARYYDRDWGNGGAIIPIEDDYVIIDEFGMCGVDHIRMILQMVEDRDVPPRLLFIGDIGQLASISAGDFLANTISLINRGMIDGQVIELTQIMRTASDSFIPFLCSMFYGNNYFDNTVIERNDMAGVEMIELREEDMASQIFDIVQDRGFDMDETAIIMPQRVGDAGCNIVNEYFQSMNNNPILYKDKFRMFKKDDALMHVKNNYKMGIFNGERINLKMESDGEYICTKVSDYSNLIYDEDLLKDQTMLSYANTTFKLQGCTVKNVIFVCNYDKHAFMLNKNLVYTSMSRASEKLIVLYNRGSLDRASQKTLVDKRSTFLGKLLELKK